MIVKMIYKFVLITFLASNALSHHYSGWTNGQYGSFTQSQELWEWHTYGQDGSINTPQTWSHENYYLNPNQQWNQFNEENAHNVNPNQQLNHDNQGYEHNFNPTPAFNLPNAVNGGNREINTPQTWSHENYYLNPNQQWNHHNQWNEQKIYPNQQWNQFNEGNAHNVNVSDSSMQEFPKYEYAQLNLANQQWNQPNLGSGQNLNPTPTFNPPNAVNGDNREADPNQQALQGAPMYNETHNPCTRELPPRPSFKRPGRRISEEKCLEFIWEIKALQDTLQNQRDCATYSREYLNVSEVAVVGGRVAEPGEFPHMGALGWKAVEGDYIFKCGGTIISPKFMITAGHCTRSARDSRISNPVPEIVRVGAKDLQIDLQEENSYPRDIKISKIIRHPSYKPPQQYFDIALLELEKRMFFDQNIQAACLWNNLNTDNIEKTSASGWGVTEIGGKQTTTELRVGDLDLINNDVCNQLLRPMCNRLWCGLEEHQICAGKLAGGVDACQGDSGGPLQAQINLHPSIKGKIYYLLGVTSFGFGCARSNSPGVYTRIATFIDWIEQNVWPNEVASRK